MSIPFIPGYMENAQIFESLHYIFHFQKGSLVERDIVDIAEGQEHCYITFLKRFSLESKLQIKYYFFESPLECGKQYRLLHADEYREDDPDEEVDGYTLYPNSIFATYNESIKCIGYHEDVHLLMAEHYGNLKSCFVKEGIAMAFDRVWWGIDNWQWSRKILEKGLLPEISMLYENEEFFKYLCMFTYPVAGSITEWLLRRIGIEEYKQYYQSFQEKDNFPIMGYRKQLVEEYLKELSQIVIDKKVEARIEKCIEDRRNYSGT